MLVVSTAKGAEYGCAGETRRLWSGLRNLLLPGGRGTGYPVGTGQSLEPGTGVGSKFGD